jgi:hypothetical protein
LENIRCFEAWLEKKEKQKNQELVKREKERTNSTNTVRQVNADDDGVGIC